ncbi:MAG: M20/M25/M40 family metallo-hydrolase [Janthinobacterium lividum]
MFPMTNLLRGVAVSGLAISTGLAVGQALSPADRTMAHDIFEQLVTTNTTHSVGSTAVAAEAMRDRLLKAGMPAGDMEIVGPSDKRLNLVVRYRAAKGATGKPVLFICHLDVVEANRSDWTLDPFQLTEKDGFFYGRGTQDVKDSDAALVTSLILLKRANFVPKRDLIIALTADEEGGADNGVAWLLKNRPDLMNAGVVINPDAGGIVLKEGRAAELNVEATEKLYADFQIVATSAGGHSSLPRPDNPIYELGDDLEKLEHTPFPAELNAVTRAYLEAEKKTASPDRHALMERVLATPMDDTAAKELSGDPRMNATLRTTCVATMISGGHAPNALPGSATANVNCRILPGHPPEEVRQHIISVLADPKLTVKYVDNAGVVFPSAPTTAAMAPPPLREDVTRPLHKVADAMFPNIAIVPIMETGASDSIYTLAAGLPSYGISGMGIDAGDDRAHGRDERIRVESFYNGVAFQWHFMKALGEESQ